MNQGEENSEETAFVVDEVSNIIKEVGSKLIGIQVKVLTVF